MQKKSTEFMIDEFRADRSDEGQKPAPPRAAGFAPEISQA
jgi:hypothetical protein